MNQQKLFEITENFLHLPEFGIFVQQSVMPLITKKNDQFVQIGTGFIISPDGLMMTASHVIEEATRYKSRRLNDVGEYYDHWELYALYITNEKSPKNEDEYIGGLIPVNNVWCPEGLDIGVCALRSIFRNEERVLFPSVRLSPSIPILGENILGFGYYGSMTETSTGQENIVNIKHSQETAFTRGKVIEVFPQARDASMLNFPCFHTDARFEGGMSGGPIFNELGFVVGVICSSMPPVEEDPRYISFGSLIWATMGIEIDIAVSPATETEKVLIYDLVQKGFITTDDSINQIMVKTELNNRRSIYLKS